MSWENEKYTVDEMRIGKKCIATIEFCPTEPSEYKWCCRVYQVNDIDCTKGQGHYYRSYNECAAYRDGLIGRTKNVAIVQLFDKDDFE